jgi:predicted transcriptional regulator YdeE
MIGKETRKDARGKALPEVRCARCNHLTDAATGIDQAVRPEPGDITICIRCGVIEQFNESMELVEMPYAELQKFVLEHPEPGLTMLRASQRIREAWMEAGYPMDAKS